MMHPLFFLLQAELIEPEIKTQSFSEILFSGGPIGVTIVALQFVMSFIAAYIFIERYLNITRAGKIDENFMNNIRMSVSTGNIKAAQSLCASTDSPISRMVEKGLMRIGKPLKEIDAAIENVGNLEIFKLEKNLSTLASIAGSAPMLGFLGTVTGMILAFYKMAAEQNVTPEVLAGGIYQALITTAFGLLVGLFSLIGYNLLVASVEKVIFKMERSTMEFMDLLQEPS